MIRGRWGRWLARRVDRAVESDERVQAWYAVADHPAMKPAYNVEGALLPAVLQRLTDLHDLEQSDGGTS